MARQRRAPRGRGGPTATRREWVGGCFPAPGHVTGEGEPYRPLIAAWLEAPDGPVVGFEAVKPGGTHGVLGRVLVEAIRRPLAGEPRRPSAIRVADPELAEEIRNAVGELAPVTIAATPEIDNLARLMLESMCTGSADDADDPEGPGYLGDGRIEAERVTELFAAAYLLRVAAPWDVAGDQQVLRVDSPDLGLDGACLSVIGALGESLGFLIFPSHAGFLAFLDAAEHPRPARGGFDLGTSWLSFTLAPTEELTATMRREIDTHGWKAQDGSYPVLEHRESDGLPRPLTADDYRVATATATSLAAFTMQNRHVFDADGFEPISQSWSDESDLTMRFTFPYEAFPLFDDADGPRAEKARRKRRPAPRAPRRRTR